MTDFKTTVELLERALTQMGEVIAAIGAEQSEWPTPCEGWGVHTLVRHVVGQDLRNFAMSARGETVDWRAPAEELHGDWAAQFRTGAAALLEVWRGADHSVPAGADDAPLRNRLDQQIAELAMHAWDLARATDQRITLDPELAEHGLAWSRQMLRPEFRGPDKAFGFEVAVAPDAPAYDRLAGWFGRDPDWKSPH
ncbi:TIGR03086 family metal-binding protein [Nocardia arthritidis]|uniref:TIGR03086 family protein n=1 Tax=Nocardia arthritidis TaxID=228602 RepID=A0A6G9YHR5_9NOCA|nr:TIGR03086 family metal-binding protein [Nocardia arthritidis]QIS12731.1 TIGR03086 family protein [Nocardia arthritidis]